MNNVEKTKQIIRGYLKIIGCGNCAFDKTETMCKNCTNKTSTGSYWCINKQYAEDIAKEIDKIYNSYDD